MNEEDDECNDQTLRMIALDHAVEVFKVNGDVDVVAYAKEFYKFLKDEDNENVQTSN